MSHIEETIEGLIEGLRREHPEYSQETIEQTRKLLAELLDYGLRVFPAKQEAYGRDNIALFGVQGITIRLHDKWQRLHNLTFGQRANKVADESLEDTLRDIGGYGFIGLLVQKKQW